MATEWTIVISVIALFIALSALVVMILIIIGSIHVPSKTAAAETAATTGTDTTTIDGRKLDQLISDVTRMQEDVTAIEDTAVRLYSGSSNLKTALRSTGQPQHEDELVPLKYVMAEIEKVSLGSLLFIQTFDSFDKFDSVAFGPVRAVLAVLESRELTAHSAKTITYGRNLPAMLQPSLETEELALGLFQFQNSKVSLKQSTQYLGRLNNECVVAPCGRVIEMTTPLSTNLLTHTHSPYIEGDSGMGHFVNQVNEYITINGSWGILLTQRGGPYNGFLIKCARNDAMFVQVYSQPIVDDVTDDLYITYVLNSSLDDLQELLDNEDPSFTNMAKHSEKISLNQEYIQVDFDQTYQGTEAHRYILLWFTAGRLPLHYQNPDSFIGLKWVTPTYTMSAPIYNTITEDEVTLHVTDGVNESVAYHAEFVTLTTSPDWTLSGPVTLTGTRAFMLHLLPGHTTIQTLSSLTIKFDDALTTSQDMTVSVYTSAIAAVFADFQVDPNWQAHFSKHKKELQLHATIQIVPGSVHIPLFVPQGRTMWNQMAVYIVISQGTLESTGNIIEYIKFGDLHAEQVMSRPLFTTANSRVSIPLDTTHIELEIHSSGEDASNELKWYWSFDGFTHIYGATGTGNDSRFVLIDNWSMDDTSNACGTADMIQAFMSFDVAPDHQMGTLDFIALFPMSDRKVELSSVRVTPYTGSKLRTLQAGVDYIATTPASDDATMFTIEKRSTGTTTIKVIGLR